MTIAIPAVTLPGAGTSQDMSGHLPASSLLVIMSRPVAPDPCSTMSSGPGVPGAPRAPGVCGPRTSQ